MIEKRGVGGGHGEPTTQGDYMTGEELEKWQAAQESYEQGKRDGQGEIVRYLVMTAVFAVAALIAVAMWQMWG